MSKHRRRETFSALQRLSIRRNVASMVHAIRRSVGNPIATITVVDVVTRRCGQTKLQHQQAGKLLIVSAMVRNSNK